MTRIHLKILIVDPNSESSYRLTHAIKKIDSATSIYNLSSTIDTFKIITENAINAIYIDPLGLGVEPTSKFIFDVREKYEEIVFVLYMDFKEEKNIEDVFYSGERNRLRNYYKLNKSNFDPLFEDEVQKSLEKCQSYLRYSTKLAELNFVKSEVNTIQDVASNVESVAVPVQLLKQIQEQLNERQRDAKIIEQLHKNADFLGSPSSEKTLNTCFVIMPYSQSWSAGVQLLIEEVCREVGFICKIAKNMQGRFVPHDIWQGITGSEVLIADLTGANANVTYEVGLADAIGCNVVLICQNNDVPFDFLGQRLIVYENSVQGTFTLKDQLVKSLKSIKENRYANS